MNHSTGFWSDRLWLPPNLTWNDVTNHPHSEIRYAEARHMLIPIFGGILLIFVRQIIEKWIFVPLGKYLGVKDAKPTPPPHNEMLERHYKRNRRLHVGMAMSLSKQTDLSEREIELWWAKRRAQDKPTILNKFCETSFKGLMYTINFYYALVILRNKTYLWDWDELFRNYPHHSLTNDVWWLLIIVLSFYWSLLIAHFYEPRRLDFYPMLIHHLLTIALVTLGFLIQVYRLFHIILVLHDVVEYLLHIIKAVKYARYEKLARILFIIFAIVWTPTRLIIYPILVYKVMFQSYFEGFPMFYLLQGLLVLLQGLHLFWTYLIYKVLRESLKGNFEDCRSSSDEMDEDE